MTSLGLHAGTAGEPVATVFVERRRGMPRLVATCAGLAGLIGVLGLIGWIFDVPALQRIVHGYATMKINSAIAFVLLATALRLPRRAAIGAGVVVGVYGVLVLAEYATGSDFGIDQALVADHGGTAHPGRPGMLAAACFILLALGVVLVRAGYGRVAEWCAVLSLVVGSLTLVGYAYDEPTLYSNAPLSTVAPQSAVALLLLGVALLASVDRGALAWVLRGSDVGATLARRLLPLAFLGLPLLGYVCVLLERHDVLTASSSLVVVVVLSAAATGSLTWSVAQRLVRVDRRRQRTLAELTGLKVDLERQIVERAAQLQSRQNQIAVLEDRQRIAADLHDIVIQRLFAAGMFLQGTNAAITDPETRQRVGTAVEAMDAAIKDLRASIFDLGTRAAVPVDLTTAVDDVCSESARILGFMPEVTVDDPDWDAEPLRDDLLAVLREALANVARHAAASSVDVVLRSRDGQVSLTVTDDGKGITSTPRSSGTRNMADRARRRGGDCTWTWVEPHGTRVAWHAPSGV